MVALLALSVALGGYAVTMPAPASQGENAAPRRAAAQIAVLARVEVLEPVTNDPQGAPRGPMRVASRTRDGRYFVEFQ